MNCRTRMTGLLMLAAMSLSLAETARAVACAPMMGHMGADAAGMEVMTDMPAEQHDCPPGHQHDPQNQSEQRIPCPFAPAGAAPGCAASAVLPATVASVTPALAGESVDTMSTETTPHFLRTASIFHPPEA